MSLRQKVDYYLSDENSRFAQALELVIAFLVLIVCFLFVIATYPLDERTQALFYDIETGITIFFLCEYLLRAWGRRFALSHLLSPLSLVDLIAIIPLFLSTSHFQFVRVLRIARILRILRLLKNRTFFFGKVQDHHLRIARIFFTLFCIIFISSGLIYDLEGQHRQDGITTFFDALYFSVVSLSTVGYGDITPITFPGRLVTLMMIISGAILIPLQVTGLVKSLLLAYNKVEAECKQCGLRQHDPDASHCKACGNLIYQSYDGEVL